MRALVVAVPLLILMVSTEAYAAQFSFDPSARPSKHDYTMAILFIATASLVGAILIVAERKKAKGIWFSNAEKLRYLE